MSLPRTVLIGAGNLGWHLGRRLHACGFPLTQVISRRMARARELAGVVEASPGDDLSAVSPDADWYILAVTDDAVEGVARALAAALSTRSGAGPVVTHTSGAVPSTALAPFFNRFGVFYPLQTFSKDRAVDFSRIPICVAGDPPEAQEQLLSWGRQISDQVLPLDDARRARVHVAAVFANNFSNFLFLIAEKILTEEQISPEILRPLMLETARKVQDRPPAAMQTGPAVRGDLKTLDKHLELLEKYPDYRELYRLLTRLLRQEFNP